MTATETAYAAAVAAYARTIGFDPETQSIDRLIASYHKRQMAFYDRYERDADFAEQIFRATLAQIEGQTADLPY